jgi:hypothetical protein
LFLISDGHTPTTAAENNHYSLKQFLTIILMVYPANSIWPISAHSHNEINADLSIELHKIAHEHVYNNYPRAIPCSCCSSYDLSLIGTA